MGCAVSGEAKAEAKQQAGTSSAVTQQPPATHVPGQQKSPVSEGLVPGVGKKKIFIIYYSMYGHMRRVAEEFKMAIDAEEGVEGILYQVAETLPQDVLSKMHAPPKADHPVIDAHLLEAADGFVFGFPTRFGMMCAQMKAFFDATGQHWQKQSLAGKPATMFTGTATQVGGQETTILTAIPILAAHGIIYVPLGYQAGAPQFGMTEVRGGGPLGAGVLAGPDGARQPSEAELALAKAQGGIIARVTKKLAA